MGLFSRKLCKLLEAVEIDVEAFHGRDGPGRLRRRLAGLSAGIDRLHSSHFSILQIVEWSGGASAFNTSPAALMSRIDRRGACRYFTPPGWSESHPPRRPACRGSP